MQIKLSDDSLARMKALLSPTQLKQAVYQTIKRTTEQSTTAVKRQIVDECNIAKKYVDRAVKSKVVGDPPAGVITIAGGPLPLIAYKPKVTRRRGVTVITAPGLKTIELHHAFEATVGSGHVGIFMRTRHVSPSRRISKKGKPYKSELTPGGFAGRLAIKEVMGPSIPTVARVPAILEGIVANITALLMKNAQSQIDRFTKGK